MKEAVLAVGLLIILVFIFSGGFSVKNSEEPLPSASPVIGQLIGEGDSSVNDKTLQLRTLKFTQVTPSPTAQPSGNPSPTSSQSREVKMMLIQYVPPGGVKSVYPEGIADTTGFIRNNFIPAINNGTKFHGYSNSSAQATLSFTLASEDVHTESNPPPTRTDNPLGAPPKADNQPGYLDVSAIFRKYNICGIAKQKNIKMVVFLMADYGQYGPKGFEDYITGNKGIPTNGPILHGSDYCDDKTIYIVNPVYTRGLPEALESYGHHLEGVFRHFKPSDYVSWSDIDSCGTDHNPPNARNEYDRSNTNNFQTDCKNWKADGTGAKESLNCSAWGCTGDGWLVWWMQNMPSSWWSHVSNPD